MQNRLELEDEIINLTKQLIAVGVTVKLVGPTNGKSMKGSRLEAWLHADMTAEQMFKELDRAAKANDYNRDLTLLEKLEREVKHGMHPVSKRGMLKIYAEFREALRTNKILPNVSRSTL
jgi:hypothetical protein